jgi:tripartite-type tricarboxylate transporter receptor subunit TctC
MKLPRIVAAAAVLAFGAGLAHAEKFPDHPIRLIVPFAAGGGVDSAARVLANDLQVQLGVPLIVENRAGASGTLGGRVVQIAKPDGYTLLFSAATHVLAKQVMKNAPYEPQTDFTPVARVGEAPLLLVVSPSVAPRSLKELAAAARQQPERWTAAIPAFGAPSHLATLLLAKHADAKFTFIPYKGTQPALIDVAGGSTNLLMDSMISVLPMAQTGRVRAIAITSANRSPLAPDVPTASESGFPGLTFASWYGVWAPKSVPADRVRILNNAINASVAQQAKAGAWTRLGIQPVIETPEQFKAFIARSVTQSAELLKSAGFEPE